MPDQNRRNVFPSRNQRQDHSHDMRLRMRITPRFTFPLPEQFQVELASQGMKFQSFSTTPNSILGIIKIHPTRSVTEVRVKSSTDGGMNWISTNAVVDSDDKTLFRFEKGMARSGGTRFMTICFSARCEHDTKISDDTYYSFAL